MFICYATDMHLDLMRDKSAVFPLPDNPQDYTSIRIWHCSYKTLEALKHFGNLKSLEIATVADDNLDFLAGMSQLETLRIIHMPHIKNLTALSKLSSLKHIELATLPSWDGSGKKTIVDSLAPLGSLKSLATLALYGVVPADNNYRCLADCSALRSLDTRGPKDAKESLNALHSQRPDIQGSFLKHL